MMNLSRDVNIKPSFLRELHSLPVSLGDQIWEKINNLAQNPIPDGHSRKKLNKWSDVYRLRVGDFRVFYSFGSNWIRLLSIRPRKNAYERDISYDEPSAIVTGVDPEIIEDEELAEGVQYEWKELAHPTSTQLPRELTTDWLTQLSIPPEYHSKLIGCKTEDDLLMSDLPDVFIERLIDNLFPRPIKEIMQQPDLALFDTNDLVRYKDGDLMGFLLRLDADQERLVDWALKGPALIKGGPGTGKSTIALYRVRSILEHLMMRGENPKLLFSTHTHALAKFSGQLLGQLLQGKEQHVKVEVADELAQKIVGIDSVNNPVADRKQLKAILEEVAPPQVLAKFRPDYLLDEIDWVIEGRNLKTLEEYFSSNRAGRGGPLSKSSKEIIWNLYKTLDENLVDRGLWTLSRIRCMAYEKVVQGGYSNRFDAVIIDEAQDLTPVTLALLVELVKDGRGIYITADSSQSIYFRGFSWSEVHDRLQFKGRAVILRRNYRTTKEISEAAVKFLQSTGSGDPDSLKSRSYQSGPQPLLLSYTTMEEQVGLINKFIRQMSSHLRFKHSATAVLVPSSKYGKDVADKLNELGMPAKFMRGSQFDLSSNEVKVLTMAAAKGLEFPMVVVTGLDGRVFPKLDEAMGEEEYVEEISNSRRVLYVGMTRAMRGLMLLYSKQNPSTLVSELTKDIWYTQD